jgi:pimeloyl-ACP methyl ester carboxylesterase
VSEQPAARVADLDGLRLHYLEAGEGPTVVFLHGAGGAPRGAEFIPALAARFRLLVPSLPGFDASDPGECQSIPDLAEAVARFVQQTAEGPVHVVGESFGGWVACWLAVLHPALVERLVLAAPASFRAAHGPAAPLSPEELERRLFGRLPATPPPPDELARRQRNAAHARRFMGPPRDEALYERLPEIQAPTLVLWGTADQMIPQESSRIYLERIPVAYRMFLYGAAHSLPVAARARFVALTADFLTRGEAFIVG